MDYTPYLLVLFGGAVGGFAYDYYNGLVTQATYLSAAYHVFAGAVAAFISVLSGVLSAPSDYASWAALIAVGYAGTDVIDSFVQKLKTSSAPATTGTTPPPAA